MMTSTIAPYQGQTLPIQRYSEQESWDTFVHVVLNCPTPEKVIERSNKAVRTKQKYLRALELYKEAGGDLLGDDAREQLADYSAGLARSAQAHLRSAVRLWGNEAYEYFKGKDDFRSPENALRYQSLMNRVQSLATAVQVQRGGGEKVHTWLTPAEVKRLLTLPDIETTIGQRDRIALGLMVAAGLRREECVNLTFDDIKLQPVKGKIRTVLQVRGKGDKLRVIPIRDSLAAALGDWGKTAGAGLVLRSVDQKGAINHSLSAVGLFYIVRGYGKQIGHETLAPHDLRRTYAQIGYEAGVAVTQISKLLGHASIATTQRYLNLALDLETTISDFVPFE